MKLFVIDENTDFANVICEHFRKNEGIKCQPFLIKESDNTSTLSDRIVNFLEEDDVLFVNINLVFNGELRQTHKGIELLTWLRIKGVMNHCVLYSFQSVEVIARSSEKNRLLFSKGTSFVQLPNKFSLLNLEILKDDLSEPNNLKENIKPLFDIGEFRHRNANWWGVKQLWDIHNIYKKGKFNKAYPTTVRDNLANLNNAVGTFLYTLDIVNSTRYIDSLVEDVERKKSEIKNQIDKYKEDKGEKLTELTVWDELIEEVKKEIQDKENNFQRYYANTSIEYQQIEEEKLPLINQINQAQEKITSTDEKILELEYQLEIYEQNLDKYRKTNEMVYEIAKKDIFKNIELTLPSNDSKILLIDDNAKNGWKEIIAEITKSTIKSFVPEKKFIDNPDQLYQEVRKLIEPKSFNPDLIMLDLRLFDETDRSIDIENFSGTLLLKRIKEEFRGIPILITTASNKVWTYQKLINLGADAYWIKEGIDEQREAVDSVNNYDKLLFLISRMTDKPYKLLRTLSEFADNFEQTKDNHWSNEYIWDNYETTNSRIDEISRSLNDAVCVLKNYLHNHFLEFGSDNSSNEAFVLSGLINKVAGVYVY